MDQDESWRAGRPRPRTHCVKWGPSSPPQRGTAPTQFLAHVYCGQTAGWIKMAFGTEVGLGPGHIVLDGNPAPHHKRCTASPIFSPRRGEAARWIKMPLGTEVGLGQGYIVLDGGPAPPINGVQQPPLFGPCLLWPNGWMDQDATWHGGRPQPRPHCVRWGLGPLLWKGHHSPPPPTFRLMSIVAKRLDGSGGRPQWHGGRPRPRRRCLRWGPSSPHGKGHGTLSSRLFCPLCLGMVAHLSCCWALVILQGGIATQLTWGGNLCTRF